MYIAKYLPVDKPFIDGCMAIDSRGEVFQWNEASVYADIWKGNSKVAELFIVTYEYNLLKIIGKPSDAVMKWIKPGMEFKKPNVTVLDEELPFLTDPSIVSIRCDVCGHQH